MEKVLQQVKQFKSAEVTYESLGSFVKQLDAEKIDYKDVIPALESSEGYSRNILTLDPFEVVVLRWPPGCESAIHYHQGFWGYVLVLEGICDNVEYAFDGKQLREKLAVRGIRNGVFDEPDGTIHKLKNASFDDELITVHFYAPALEDFDNMVLYREDGTIGVLNDKAESASFSEPPEHFKELKHNAFEFVSYSDQKNPPSHRIFPVVPKPESKRIGKMIGSYYAEQAHYYDSFDLKHESRSAYTEKINRYISDDLKGFDVSTLLDIACGTGRRAVDIRDQSGIDYDIIGIDISKEMTNIASSRGVEVIHNNWLKAPVDPASIDVVTFLYAFGHIATKEEREESLHKIYTSLRKGGRLYLDVFNMNDKSEWGPLAVRRYNELNLDEHGYEKGDVFYKKVGGQEIAYLHYFDEDTLREKLGMIGFTIEWVKHIGYVSESGKEVDADRGALFIKAVKQ